MKVVTRLLCEQEKANDRLPYHVSHAVKVDSIKAALVCSSDTGVHTSLLHNFEQHQKQHGRHKLWFQHNKQINLVHESVTKLVCILPALHALTGSNTICNVGTKDKAFKVTCNSKHQQQLPKFGENDLNSEVMKNVKK